MIIVFDLDDTLYEEINYVDSGFRAVANHLSNQYNIQTPEVVHRELILLLEKQGRGKIFDRFLERYNLSNKWMIKKCLAIYRSHDPDICLSTIGRSCLERFQGFPKYLVTDGNKVVQTKKIKSLEIDNYFKRILITHNYGLKYSKPSTYCFHKILKWEDASPSDLVYVGDNPQKDFVNLKSNGFKTVRVLTGEHRNVVASVDYEAHAKINSLNELSVEYLRNMFEK